MTRRGFQASFAVVLTFILLPRVAWSDPAPRTDRVLASFGMTRTIDSDVRSCVGEDGEYNERHDEFEGDVESLDSRLTGRLTVRSDMLINLTTGLGTGNGTWEIRDSASGNLKLTGSFQGVVVELNRFKGLATAQLTGGGRVVANLSVVLTPAGAFGNIGSALTGVESDPAVIQVGSCSGGFGP